MYIQHPNFQWAAGLISFTPLPNSSLLFNSSASKSYNNSSSTSHTLCSHSHTHLPTPALHHPSSTSPLQVLSLFHRPDQSLSPVPQQQYLHRTYSRPTRPIHKIIRMSAGKLQGKVALVTGASTGIGRASAIAFAKEGAKVVLAARTEEKLQAVADEITSAGGEAIVVAGDVSKEADCKRMVDAAVEKFGGLHVAFNNAGTFAVGTFADITEESMNKMLDVNFKSLVYCFKYQIPAMAKSGDKGSIVVNTSCTASRVSNLPAMNGGGVYAATKAGADMLMKYAAIEGAASGVRVNSVAPGHVETPIYGDMPLEMLTSLAKSTQLIGRPIQSDEIAKVVTFLASDDAAMVTGSVYLMDGGWSIKA